MVQLATRLTGLTVIATANQQSITISWEMMFTRSLFQTADMVTQHRLLNEVSALVDLGVLTSTLTRNMGRIDAENLRKAHREIESGRAIGKVVPRDFDRPATVLRPAYFIQNDLRMRDPLLKFDTYGAPIGSKGISIVATSARPRRSSWSGGSRPRHRSAAPSTTATMISTSWRSG